MSTNDLEVKLHKETENSIFYNVYDKNHIISACIEKTEDNLCKVYWSIGDFHNAIYMRSFYDKPKTTAEKQALNFINKQKFPETNVFWRALPKGAKVIMQGQMYIAFIQDPQIPLSKEFAMTRAVVYWSGQVAKQAQTHLDNLVKFTKQNFKNSLFV
jgi:hypothetical protein